MTNTDDVRSQTPPGFLFVYVCLSQPPSHTVTKIAIGSCCHGNITPQCPVVMGTYWPQEVTTCMTSTVICGSPALCSATWWRCQVTSADRAERSCDSNVCFCVEGVGGIEAEAVMLGQPISMVLPQVVGYKLHGTPDRFITSTDIVLTVTKVSARTAPARLTPLVMGLIAPPLS